MSLNINEVRVCGNLGQDPKINYLDGGTCKATFSLAVNESYKNKQGERIEQTEWINVVFFGIPATIIEQHVKKGTRLYVEGKMKTRSWEKEGAKHYMTEVRGDSFQFAGPAQGQSTTDNQPQGQGFDESDPFAGEGQGIGDDFPQ